MSPRLPDRARTILRAREAMLGAWGKRLFHIGILFAFGGILVALLYAFAFGPAGPFEEQPEFIVMPEDTLLSVSQRLEADGLVRYAPAFRFAYALSRGDRTMRPGGYALSPSMDALRIAKTLSATPRLAWIVIPEGKRKEEVARILADALGWTAADRRAFLAAAYLLPPPSEGMFYADTYLIPSDQSPAQVAARLRNRFEEAFAPYAEEAKGKGTAWRDLIILASLIERESAKNDKRLVSGILHNRLERGMLLQVDATLQYLRGKEGNWWPLPDPADKTAESPFNTYRYGGLPPEPIATPSIASIEAALNPEPTTCLFYLHDAYGRIHCTATYSGHLANINRYLR